MFHDFRTIFGMIFGYVFHRMFWAGGIPDGITIFPPNRQAIMSRHATTSETRPHSVGI